MNGIEHVPQDEAMNRLRLSVPSAREQWPQFVQAPQPLAADEKQIVFECTDNANNVSTAVAIKIPSCRTEAQARDAIANASVSALDVAERVAKAVFN